MLRQVRLRSSVKEFLQNRKAQLRAIAGDDPQDCDAIYAEYGGKSVGAAMGEGFVSGLAGMVGAGSFFSPVSDSAIKNITAGFDELKSKWDSELAQYQQRLTKTQMDFHNRQLDLLSATATFHDEILQERIATNTLLITVLFAGLVIVIFYLVSI